MHFTLPTVSRLLSSRNGMCQHDLDAPAPEAIRVNPSLIAWSHEFDTLSRKSRDASVWGLMEVVQVGWVSELNPKYSFM